MSSTNGDVLGSPVRQLRGHAHYRSPGAMQNKNKKTSSDNLPALYSLYMLELDLESGLLLANWI